MLRLVLAIKIVAAVMVEDTPTMGVDVHTVGILPDLSRVEGRVGLFLPLVDPHIIYLIAYRKLGIVNLPTVGAHRQIQKDVLRCLEWINLITFLTVDCLRQRNFVEQFVVHIEPD